MNQHEDIALVKRVLNKERAAFNEFFETYFARLYRFSLSRVSEERICEDIVQETLCKAIRKLDQYRGEASLFTWLCQICRNEIFTWYRKQDNQIQLVADLDDDPLVRASLESLSHMEFNDETERHALEKIVQLVLDYLPNNYGKVLELKYLEDLSVQEIASKMGTTAIAVQSLLARARTAFRKGFDELNNDIAASKV